MTPRRELLARLSERPEPPLASIAEFFDGNDDLGSIGCNLEPHPGLAIFHERLAMLAARPDVESVHVCIAELDPGDESWPFADTVFVVGSVAPSAVAAAVEALEPDEVRALSPDEVSELPDVLHHRDVTLVWWD